ncbi:elongator complex protein 6-like [Telopea speciosissima]|uniref:elongator complex protein 6-like n=1 Tax=Telopea speciosissima TaxID=54955 RepID=UPI001CC755C6|nr:elongator complex protein 6-like [Telopea speciosissima]
MDHSLNVLDEALRFNNATVDLHTGRVVLIEDCVETSGAFVLHQLIKRSLSPNSYGVVLFVAFAQPFSHYERILRKLSCNLVTHRDNGRFFFFDMPKLHHPNADVGNSDQDRVVDLYGKIQKALEVVSISPEYKNSCITIMIDDISLMEVAANGTSNNVVDFLHYCHTLTSELGCSLVILNHEDIYSDMMGPTLILQMEYLADVVIKAEPLVTGLAPDVHGQLTVINKRIIDEQGSLRNRVCNFHFNIKENNVEYFYPGSRS